MRPALRAVWAAFRRLPVWGQIPVGVLGSVLAVGLVTAPFNEPPTAPAAPATMSTSSTTTSSSTTTTSTSSTTTSTTVAATTSTAAATTTVPTTVARVTTTTARAVVTTVVAAAPVSCPNGTYTNTAGNEVCRPYASSNAPAGASAQCRDGTYSFSQTRSGTCSGHGGVAQWL